MVKKTKLKIGDPVDYHSIIGGEITSTGHMVTCFTTIGEEPCAFISKVDGKPSGAVSFEALTPTPKVKKTLKDLGEKKDEKKTEKVEKPKKEKKKPVVKTKMITGKYFFKKVEKEEMAGDLARTQMDKREVEDEKKSVMAGYKDRLDRFDFDINRLSRNVVNGYEMREFECKIVKNFTTHKKRFIDIRTKKLIDERPLDPSDYQKELDI